MFFVFLIKPVDNIYDFLSILVLLAAVDEVSLEHMPVVMQYGGLQIEPITEGRVQQKVVWEETGTTSKVNRFIQYLKDETSI